MHEIYEYICANSTLKPEHHAELKSKRGFSDQTIKDQRLFSSGQHMTTIESKLRSKFSREDLLKSKTFILSKNDDISLTPQLLKDNVVIPYLDKDNKCYFIRPHKYGLKDSGVQIFQEKSFTSDEIVLSEGEFKAIACHQLDIPAISIPGISSYSAEHYKHLLELLKKHKIKKIYIIFDNEIKNNPDYDNYKPEPIKRYDTQFYQWWMCKSLYKDGYDCRIVVLPESWMVNGKIDIDMALSQGKTKDDFKRLQLKSVGSKHYYESLSKEAQGVLTRKNATKWLKSHIVTKFNKYHAIRSGKFGEFEEEISNFVIKIVATHETIDGIERRIKFINEFGEDSSVFTIQSEFMASSDMFRKFCMTQGNFLWRGKNEDLMCIWELEFLNDTGKRIIESDSCGYLNKPKKWLFGNVMIGDKGDIIKHDENGIFWVDDKGYKPSSLIVSSGKSTINDGLPFLYLKDKIDIETLESKLFDTFGGHESKVVLGWVFAVLFMEEVFSRHGSFPFLFICGKHGSGKTHVSEWLMHFFGIENSGKIISDTTEVALGQSLAYYSSLPFHLDEYRNDKKVERHNGFLRNAYNRQSSLKGMKFGKGLRQVKIKGTLIISGQETPKDNALLTRCILLNVIKNKRLKNHFNWFVQHRYQFSYLVYDLLRRKHTLIDKFYEVLEDGKGYFIKCGLDDRTALNYAIILAGYEIGVGINTKVFAEWLGEQTVTIQEEMEEEQYVNIFFEDLFAMQTEFKDINKYIEYNKEEECIYIYFHGLFNIWAKAYRQIHGTEPFKEQTIRSYLKEEKGFLEISRMYRMEFDQKPRRCVKFHEPNCFNGLLQFIQ